MAGCIYCLFFSFSMHSLELTLPPWLLALERGIENGWPRLVSRGFHFFFFPIFTLVLAEWRQKDGGG